MATKEKIKSVIGTIKILYPNYAKEVPPEALLMAWGKLLDRFPDEIVEVAFVKALETRGAFINVTDVIAYIKEIERASKPTDEKLWVLLTEALRETNVQVYKLRYPEYGVDHRAKITEIWEGLPEEIKQYLGGKGELMQLSKCSPDELKYEKNRFFKRLPSIREGIENDLLPSLTDGNAERGMLCDSSATHS